MIGLRHKLWLGFGGLLLVLVVVSILAVVVLTRYSQTLERLFRENFNSAVYCDAMKASLDEVNDRAQQLIWQESAARLIDTAAPIQRFDDNLNLQLGNCTLRGETERSNLIAIQWLQYKTQYGQFEAADPAHRPQLFQRDLLPLYQKIKGDAQWIADANMSNMVSVDGQVKRTLVEVRQALLTLVIAGTIVAFFLVSTAGAAILRPLAALTASARQIEAGNLDLRVPVQSRDEIGILAEAFNSMAAKLGEFRRIDHQKLLRTQKTTQLAIDSLPDAVFVIGPAGAVEISNRTAQNYFGIVPGALVCDLKLQWLSDLYNRVLNKDEPVETDGYKSAIQLFANGAEHFLLPRAVPMHAEDAAPIGVTMILVDVTRLRQADELKSGLVSTVSHELRTPLTSIRMGIHMLAGDKLGPLTPRQRMAMDSVKEDSDRLYRTIENLLNISRIEAGRAQYQFRQLRPEQIVAQAVEPMRAGFAQKPLELKVTIADGLPEVSADQASIVSALTNLLTNALKFTPANGTVSVCVQKEGDAVAFTVADTGPGISPEFQSRIFEKFFRVPSAYGPSGAGLGLSIVKEIVEAHHGQVSFKSPPGCGCTFQFTLPTT